MATIKKEQQDKIQNIQVLEQNMQTLFSQRQQLQQQLAEVESALSESKETTKTYKIIGSIMLAVDKEKLQKELTEKKEMIDLRVKNIEKQEDKIKEKAKKLQEEVMQDISTEQ